MNRPRQPRGLRGLSRLSELNPRMVLANQMKAEVRRAGGRVTAVLYKKGQVVVQYKLFGRGKQMVRAVTR